MENNQIIKINNTEISLEELTDMLCSQSTFTALRHAYKNPTRSGVDECEDSGNIDLYYLLCELRGLK